MKKKCDKFKVEEEIGVSQYQEYEPSSSKKSKNNKATLLLVIFIALLIGSAYLLSPINRIKHINVYGTDHMTQEQIVQSAGIREDQPLVETWLDRSYHENQLLQQEDHVQAVDLKVEDHQTLALHVTEHDVLAQVESTNGDGEEGSLNSVLDNGEVIPAKNSAIDAPLLINFNPSDDRFTMMVEELQKTNPSVINLISEIELLDLDHNPRLLKLNMNDGSQVLVNISYFANRINYYPLLADAVDNERGLFDLEAGSFFTPYASQAEDVVDEAQAEEGMDQVDEEVSGEESEPN